MDQKLKTGDKVEVLFGRFGRPSLDFLDPQRRWLKATVVAPQAEIPFLVKLFGLHLLKVKLEEGCLLNPDKEFRTGEVVTVSARRVRAP